MDDKLGGLHPDAKAAAKKYIAEREIPQLFEVSMYWISMSIRVLLYTFNLI